MLRHPIGSQSGIRDWWFGFSSLSNERNLHRLSDLQSIVPQRSPSYQGECISQVANIAHEANQLGRHINFLRGCVFK